MGLRAIICGDSLRVLGTLKSGTVDICLTDPPFNVGLRYSPTKKKVHGIKSQREDNLMAPVYWQWFKDVFREVYRVMRPGYLYLSHSDPGVYHAKPILEGLGFKYRQGIIWWGPNSPSFRSNAKYWSMRHDQILFMVKGDPAPLITNQKGLHFASVIRVPRPQTNFKEMRLHPTQKPVKLYVTLLKRTPGQVVLDPFSGGGTTARACRHLGRDYIVIDKYKEYCHLARQDIPWKQ